MLRKIITYFLILAVVLPAFAAAIPLPAGGQVWGVKISHAIGPTIGPTIDTTIEEKEEKERKELVEAQLEKQKAQSAEVNGMCDIFWGKGTFVGCAMWLFVDLLLYKIVLKLSVLVASIAGTMFNISIGFSLTGSIFDADKNLMIKDGWTYVRDLLNLVFIFILLYAAISTILQYGNVDIKKILPSLIVAALLVNFSLMISKMVIDASHVLAWEFYNQINVNKKTSTATATANIGDEIEVLPIHGAFEKKNLANVFLAGFNPQKMLTGDTSNPSAFATAMKKAQDKKDKVGIFSLMTQMMIILVLQSALAILAGFVLLAGAIMFVLRVMVLWLVMIFSPLAFLGMILPSMKKYSDMWWKYLIGQSFFAPAFLFMFMLVTKFINDNFIDSIVGVTENSNLKIAFGLNAAVMIIPIFHFMIVGGLMMMCLIVAKQLGGKTAEFGISWAHKGKNLALGGALKYVPKPLLRHTVGKVSSDIAKSGWAERMAARSPVIGGWMKGVLKKGGDVGGFDKIMEQRIKTGQGLSTPELRAQYFSNLSAREQAEWYKGSSARTRVELEDAALKGRHTTALNNMIDVHKKLSLEEQEKTIKARAEVDLKKTDDQLADVFLSRSEEIQKEIINQIKDARKVGFINKLHSLKGTTPEFATATTSTTPTGNNIRKFRPDLINTSTVAGMTFLEEAIKKHKPEDVLLLDKNIANNPEVIREMVKNYKGGHANKIIERGDELYTKFKDELKAISGGSNSVSVVVSNLQRIGNTALASIIQSNEIMQKSLGLV